MSQTYLVDFPGLGIHDLPVSRVAFEFEIGGYNFAIYWYGILIALALLLCMLISIRQAGKFDLKGDDIADTYLLMIPMLLIGARLYYVIFSWEQFRGDWKQIFNTRYGGLAFYGGVIGGILAVYIMARIKKIPIPKIFDYLIVYIPLGQAIGRWGNFFNQEAFGTNTTLPWGMYSNGTEAFLRTVGGNVDPSAPVHPTFFYEFIANLLIFIILLMIRKRSKRPFTTTLSYFLLYGLVRFFVEGIRTDPLLLGNTQLRVSQLLSAAMVVGSLVLLAVIASLMRRREPLLAYVEARRTAEIEVFSQPADSDATSAEDDDVETSANGSTAAIVDAAAADAVEDPADAAAPDDDDVKTSANGSTAVNVDDAADGAVEDPVDAAASGDDKVKTSASGSTAAIVDAAADDAAAHGDGDVETSTYTATAATVDDAAKTAGGDATAEIAIDTPPSETATSVDRHRTGKEED